MPETVHDACVACFDAHRGDCSGFVRAVAQRLGIPVTGLADEIVDTIRAGAPWQVLADGIAAARSAEQGHFVIGGLRGDQQAHRDEHGHVVVVTGDPLAFGHYPTAWWGQLGGQGASGKTINFAWTPRDRDRVTYAQYNAG